jgi:hypothetical protein
LPPVNTGGRCIILFKRQVKKIERLFFGQREAGVARSAIIEQARPQMSFLRQISLQTSDNARRGFLYNHLGVRAGFHRLFRGLNQ